jgi:uncharacterized delta-60 repeat protein
MKWARTTCSTTMFEGLEARQLLSAGQLDTTFGDGGIVTTNHGMGVANRIVMQSDGRFVVNARRDDGAAGSFQANYNTDGSLDGKHAITPWAFDTSGAITVREPLTQADEDRLGIDIVAPDGKVLHLGMMTFAQGVGRESITRYNADGTLDNSFGDHGKLVLTWAADANPSASSLVAGSGLLSVQADGSLLLARPTGFDAGADLQLVRLTASGQVDATFGTAGVATAIDGGTPRFVALQADGKILVATDQGALGGRTRQANVMRFNANGTLDGSFGTGGRVTETNGDGKVYSRSLTITPDGKIVLLGDQSTDASEDFVIRYNADGTRDNSFNGTGKQTLLATTMGILLDGDGRIVTSGYTTANGRDYIFSQRVNADGTIDAGYGDAGRATIRVDAKNYVAQAMTLTPDGDLIIAGGTWAYSSSWSAEAPATDVLLVRLQGGDGAGAGVQRAVTGHHHHRSPKQAAREAAALAAAAAHHHHRSPKQRARDEAAAAAAAAATPVTVTLAGPTHHHHRSPKQRAREAALIAEIAAAAHQVFYGTTGV